MSIGRAFIRVPDPSYSLGERSKFLEFTLFLASSSRLAFRPYLNYRIELTCIGRRDPERPSKMHRALVTYMCFCPPSLVKAGSWRIHLDMS